MTKKINEERIKKLNEDIKNLSLQDVQLITLRVVTEKVAEKLKKQQGMLEYYQNEAEGTLPELRARIDEYQAKIDWNEHLLRMLSVKSLSCPNGLSISPKEVGEYMGWDFNPYEETKKKAEA